MKPLIALLAVLVAVPADASCYYRQRVYVPYVKQIQVVLFQVGVETRAEAIAQKAAEKAVAAVQAQHAAEIQSLKQQLAASVSGKICVELNGAAAASGATGQPTPAVSDAPAQAVVNANCTRCHQGPGSEGGDKDFRDLSKLDELTRHRIELRARVGEMPPKGKGNPVSDADAQVLQQWILGK